MATQETQQGVAQNASQGSGSLKAKYVEALRKSVVDPLRHDLAKRQESLRNEMRQLDAGGQAEAQKKLERLGRLSNTLDTELARIQNLRLSDFA
jgi:hypothetical protein